MKRTSAEIKQLARGNLVHRYGIPIAALVTTEAVTSALLLPFSWNLTAVSPLRERMIYYVAVFIVSLIGVILAVGRLVIALRIARGQEYHFTDLFYGFKHHADRYILAELLLMAVLLLPAVLTAAIIILSSMSRTVLQNVIIIGAVIVFLVVLLILSLQYALVFYILIDHPEWKLLEAFGTSRAWMKGNKGRLFYIYLSFIGWLLLVVLSFGIGSLWVTPYMVQTQTQFYLGIAEEKKAVREEGTAAVDEVELREEE